MKTLPKGFTLVELMVVIGILAAIAIPMYMNTIKRAQVPEVFSLANGSKSQIVTYYTSFNRCPDNSSASSGGIAIATEIRGKYVEAVYVATGGVSASGPDIHDVICVISVAMDPQYFSSFLPRANFHMYYNMNIGLGDNAPRGSYKRICASLLATKILT